MTEMYSCRRLRAGQYQITKFDQDLNPVASYETSKDGCLCKAGAAPKCRHRTMLPIFIEAGHVGDGWQLDWQTRLWYLPVQEVAEALQEAGIVGAGREVIPGVMAYEFPDRTLPAPDSPQAQEIPVQSVSDTIAQAAPEVERPVPAPSGASRLAKTGTLNRRFG